MFLFEEDTTRFRNKSLNGNLAVLRCALIALKAQDLIKRAAVGNQPSRKRAWPRVSSSPAVASES